MRHPQLNGHGGPRHRLTIEGLPKQNIVQILDTASSFLEVSDRQVKKVPLLRGKSVFNLFFENSTRTRTTFEIAATRLSADVVNLDVRTFTDMREGLRGVDVVIMLRLQNERMRGALLPSAQEYFKHYGLTAEKLALAKPDAIVMHPGPMNRGVEIDSAVADGAQSVILEQVTFGIAVRMAVMSILAGNR